MLGKSMRRRRKRGRSGSRARSGIRWGRWLVGGLAAVAAAFAAGYAIAVFVIFPAPERAGRTVPVPELVGTELEEAEAELREQRLAVGTVTELPHPSEPEGVVLAQSPVPGQELLPGAEVRLAVSAGPRRVRVPDVRGFGAPAAESLLESLGFRVRRREQPSNRPTGRVLRVEPAPGTPRTLPARVTLVVSAGVPAPVVSDSLPALGDTLFLPPAVPTGARPPDRR